MSTLTHLVIAAIALLHGYFMLLEMFFWTRPLGLRTFALTPEFAHASKKLAANQGLYNGFLAAGLGWGLLQGRAGETMLIFLLACIVVAGIYGAFSVAKKIFWLQAMPAVIALSLLLAP